MKKHSIHAILLSSAFSLSLLISAFGIAANAHADGVTAVAGDSLAVVSFTLINGSTPATYDVVSYPDYVTVSGAKSSPVTVKGLKNNTPYTFTVTRTDALGSIPIGTTTKSVTPYTGATNPDPAATNGIQSNLNLAFHLDNPISGDGDLLGFVQTLLKAVVLLLTPVIVIMMLYAGFMFVTAQGNGEKLTEAKNALVYTMIGAAIVLGAEGFATILKSTVNCLAGGTGC